MPDPRRRTGEDEGTALSRPVAGRVAGLLFCVSGIVTGLSSIMPAPEGMNRIGVLVIGILAFAGGLFYLVVPWGHLPRWVMYAMMVIVANVLIAFHNYYGGLDPYRYTLFFCVLYVLIGLTQPRGRALLASPVSALAYVAPLLAGGKETWTVLSVFYAIPVFILIGESTAYFGALLSGSLAESQRRARTDLLTGLGNRIAFYDWLAAAWSSTAPGGTTVAVLYIDLDGFKLINDRFGHDSGDEVLRVTSQRLKTSVRESDRVARLGGDEFAIVLWALDDAALASAIAQRVVDAIRAPITIGVSPVTVGVSVGVAVAPVSSTDPDEVVRASDQAMYAAKRGGGNRFMLCDAQPCTAVRS